MPNLKTAVLIGLSIAMSSVCDANAATTTPVTMAVDVFSATGVTKTTETLQFPQFNPSLGTLTSVDFSLSSSISGNSTSFLSAVVAPGGALLTEETSLGSFNFTNTSGLLAQPAAFYTGSGNIDVDLTINSTGLGSGAIVWQGGTGGGTDTGLTLAYDYTPAPLPAALPLFAGGLGAMGLLGWRRKRKVQATAA